MSRHTCILTGHICALHGLMWNYIMLVIILIPYFPYFTQVRYLIPRLNLFTMKSENIKLQHQIFIIVSLNLHASEKKK